MIRKATTRAVCLAAAGILGSTVLFGTAAHAAVGDGPGGLTLTPTSGSTHDDPIATFSSATACPADFRNQGAVGILTDEEFPALFGLAANFTPTDTPPSGKLDEGTGLADIMASNGLPSGDYQIAVVCFKPDFETAVPDNVWIHVDLAAATWNVIQGGPGNPGAVTTTTSLTATPSTVDAGAAVALTATVTGAGAAGSVEFFDGATSLGTATVAGGTATKSVDTLSAGTHSVTAKFTPTDPNAFTSSTSSSVTVTVNGGTGGGGQTGGQTVTVTVPPANGGGGDLTMSVGSAPVALTQQGDALSFQGSLSPITVTDGRDQLTGWHVDGQTSDFTGGGNTIDGKQLGWAPAVTTQNQAQDVVKGADVTAGSPGLKQAATLASAAANKGAGSATLGGKLDLEVPAETPAGSYSATLTVTLMGN
jgi:hypothetical protein